MHWVNKVFLPYQLIKIITKASIYSFGLRPFPTQINVGFATDADFRRNWPNIRELKLDCFCHLPHSSQGSYWPSQESALTQGAGRYLGMILVGSNTCCRSSGSDTPPCPNVTSTPQHHSQAPGCAQPSGTPNPALNEGREGDTQRKSLSPVDSKPLVRLPHMLTPVCDTQRCPQTLPVQDFYPLSTTPKLLVFNIGDATRKSQGKSITALEVILV